MESKGYVKENHTNSKVAAKAGLWYTICNFLFKGMVFLTTPVFTRLMSKDELGNFSNFSAWASILLIFTSLDLSQSIIRSKLEHEEDMDSYVWSIYCIWISMHLSRFFCRYISNRNEIYSCDVSVSAYCSGLYNAYNKT